MINKQQRSQKNRQTDRQWKTNSVYLKHESIRLLQLIQENKQNEIKAIPLQRATNRSTSNQRSDCTKILWKSIDRIWHADCIPNANSMQCMHDISFNIKQRILIEYWWKTEPDEKRDEKDSSMICYWPRDEWSNYLNREKHWYNDLEMVINGDSKHRSIEVIS